MDRFLAEIPPSYLFLGAFGGGKAKMVALVAVSDLYFSWGGMWREMAGARVGRGSLPKCVTCQEEVRSLEYNHNII